MSRLLIKNARAVLGDRVTEPLNILVEDEKISKSVQRITYAVKKALMPKADIFSPVLLMFIFTAAAVRILWTVPPKPLKRRQNHI